MKLTHNSLSTLIAWVSSCLLAGGISTMFNDDTRMIWMHWGYFGLVSAVGLDITARVRERLRIEQLNRVAATRFDKEVHLEQETKESITVIREVITNLLDNSPTQAEPHDSRRTAHRHICQIPAEIRPFDDTILTTAEEFANTYQANITNLSILGFELSLNKPLHLNKVTITFTTARHGQICILAQVLWCSPGASGVYLAGGRFLKIISVEHSDSEVHTGKCSSEIVARLAISSN